ncbi:hypothetical protein LX32DRAFT_15349 [Colletotrichum zoysiae]|uniref:Uncharacterized protein n=1 Tax=Colletotrichum zoysiae TaxID=1216348 RepID=A0AAD9HE77_9PEZI|nr:hypothetical protein LX32DRAFT_15349 [Colletotrichum zoysiae]
MLYVPLRFHSLPLQPETAGRSFLDQPYWPQTPPIIKERRPRYSMSMARKVGNPQSNPKRGRSLLAQSNNGTLAAHATPGTATSNGQQPSCGRRGYLACPGRCADKPCPRINLVVCHCD